MGNLKFCICPLDHNYFYINVEN